MPDGIYTGSYEQRIVARVATTSKRGHDQRPRKTSTTLIIQAGHQWQASPPVEATIPDWFGWLPGRNASRFMLQRRGA